ncbi:MAG: class I fructose-bisphosphate aldolase [Candidatus Paceibacterota bacterium]
MNIHDTVRRLMQDGKGVLAVDEDTLALQKYFSAFNIAYTENSERSYFELLFETPGIEKLLSAVIVSEERIKQTTLAGVPFSDLISSKNILVGVHIDESISENVSARLQEYKSLAITCAKKTVRVEVTGAPVSEEFSAEAHDLASFGVACQEKDIVPILGLELVQAGPHTAEQAEGALAERLSIFSDVLMHSDVDHKGLIIEVSMASSGSENPLPAEPKEVAERTLHALSIPTLGSVGGVLFFSDGETPEIATADLNAIARLEPFPWPVAFCFSRALQEPVFRVWQGSDEHKTEAQAALYEHLLLNVRADGGGYGQGMESR